jgi:hypothetical protein
LGFDISSAISRDSFLLRGHSIVPATSRGIEEAVVKVFGREPIGGSSGWTEKIGLINVGSGLLEDPLL